MKISITEKSLQYVFLLLFILYFGSCESRDSTQTDSTAADSTAVEGQINPGTSASPILRDLNQEVTSKNLSFTVGQTSVLNLEIAKITGEKPMSDSQSAQIKKQVAREEASKPEGESPYLTISGTTLSPNSPKLDLRDYGLVTPVRDQGAAGSCWAFGSLSGYESSYGFINSRSINTSEQFVINCSGAGTAASGGWAFEVFRWMVKNNKNIDDETVLPYSASDGNCNTSSPQTDYFAINWDFVDPNGDPSAIPTVTQIKEAMCKHGVISASVYVSRLFQAYTGGIFDENENTSGTNHAISLVGWDDDKQAWILKNSWGNNWGETCSSSSIERGYMWIAYKCNNIGRRAAWVVAKKSLRR